MTAAQRSSETRTVGEGADLITYDVHGDLAQATPERPVLVAVGSPMDAVGFLALAGELDDRPAVTLDPRGAGRNPTSTEPMTPQQHAEDLHRVIEALGAGPVDVFASSGGAVNALAHAAAYPQDVRRVVVHEPPLATFLPDRDTLLAACEDLRATYEREGHAAAMAGFITLVMTPGEIDAAYLEQPAADPAAFEMPTEDDGSRDDPLFRNLPACNALEPDLERLRELGDRLVLVVGEDSGETFAARGARSVARALGQEAVVVPGDHGGFMGEVYGQPAGKPEEFAVALRELLA
ncbi:putative hydrolases or acyltransferases (alpha/beta hydrolase superfamily) [Serinicoccus hydrothermalis]|uniref:Putative hydrolases or acyltransferases (Alpha/beta hydrolase superfamily) n=1 Tax=Serinicoccus hydrothermalis TaxID=1758689 RepID=A0A1B1NDI0_9MICO|nr:alpha/beta hydrolase [Serinicoccus hydrothermalis]ANS79415.1 putative hydrolases or acyltransferases (alpha/beta hydrolase superfamily) [Serinicoccus hydrothermalis]